MYPILAYKRSILLTREILSV